MTNLIGGLAQLARAPALHAGGQRFESVILHAANVRMRRYADMQMRNHLHIHTSEIRTSAKRSLTYWKK